MEQTINLWDCWRIVRKRWLILVLIPLVAVCIGAVFSFFVEHPVYKATATMIVGKKSDPDTDKQFEYKQVLGNEQLAQTYREIARSRTVLQRVSDQLKGNPEVDKLRDEVDIQAIRGTSLIAISAEDNNPERAADIANLITKEFTSRVLEIKKIDSVELVDAAVVPTEPMKSNKLQTKFAALVIGLFLALGMVFLLEFLDNTVKTPEDVEALTGLNVLGTIPRLQI